MTRRAQILPNQIKKRSSYQMKHSKTLPVKVPGERVPTSTGYQVRAFENRSFETYLEVMLPGTVSDKLCHAKKDRVIWVLSGQGFLTIKGVNDDTESVRRLIPGEHVALPRGTTHRFATTSTQPLEMLITQQSKYLARAEVVQKSDATRTPSESDLEAPSTEERLRMAGDLSPRRGSKAAQQQSSVQRKRARRRPSAPQGPEIPLDPSQTPETMRYAASAGLNALPSGGRFDDTGAG